MDYADKIYLIDVIDKMIGWHQVKGEHMGESYRRIVNHCGSIEDGRRMILAESMRYDTRIKSILLSMKASEISELMADYEENLFCCGDPLNEPK